MAEGTVYDRFAASAQRWPDRAFLNVLPETASTYAIAPGEISYFQGLAEVDQLRVRYRDAGYGHGHRVGLLLENRPEFLWHWLALNACGAGIVPINPDLRQAELEYLTAHSGMVLAVALPGRHGDLAKAAPALRLVAPGEAPPPPGQSPHEQPPDRECALLYTSGTTGRPKGCVLTNTYFLHCGDWYANVGGHLALRTDPRERMLTPLPLFHMNALACSAMAMITVGGCLTVLDRFHPKTWWDSVRAARATIIHTLGVMAPLLMAEPDRSDDRAHAVRFAFAPGTDPALHAAIEARFGIPFIEGWGMTETGAGGIIMTTHAPRKTGTACIGRPRNGVEARVVRDDGTETAADEPGELLVRRAGPDPRRFFFREYHEDPDATARAWEGGWFHTGDVVLRDTDGDLHFVDRKKNVIRRSGENISAAEVESMLGRHPAIVQVAVSPIADDLRSEEVFALVVTNAAHTYENAQEITLWCLDQMAYFKAPGRIAFVDTLPRTATEKLQRGEIRTLAERALDEGRAFDLRALKKRR